MQIGSYDIITSTILNSDLFFCGLTCISITWFILLYLEYILKKKSVQLTLLCILINHPDFLIPDGIHHLDGAREEDNATILIVSTPPPPQQNHCICLHPV